jgi:hypothetical protein
VKPFCVVLVELEGDGDDGIDLEEMFSIKERRVLVVRRHLWVRLDVVEG